MRQWKSIAAGAALVLAAGAADAQAQVGFQIGGGPSFATGDLGDAVDMGYNVQGSATLSLPLFPVSFRADALFNQHPGDDHGIRILGGNVNAVFSIPSVGITPYIIGGIGMYSSKATDEGDAEHDHESQTDTGFNIGAGVRLGLPGLAVFAEARLHSISTEGGSTRIVPVTLGVRF